MMSFFRRIKVAIVCLMIINISFFNYAAIVSDNDGSAFVTKAEFESMKKSFDEQVAQYNTSIDGKIDGAIATYLAGIKLSKKGSGTNYISNMSDVRFYSVTKTLQTSEISDVRRRWLVRAFGASSPVTDGQLKTLRTFGSWLYNSSTDHGRDGTYNYSGNATNYFYQVGYRSINGTKYACLQNNNSMSLLHTVGAFASTWASGYTSAWATPVTFNWGPYNLDVSDMLTNTVEPWSYTWSNFGFAATAQGYKMNVWSKSNNASDTVPGYYYFNNNQITTDTDIYIFDEQEFRTFGDPDVSDGSDIQTFTCPGEPAHDIWFSYHTNAGDTFGSDWSYRRVYIWGNWANPAYESWFTASNLGTLDRTHATINYRQPNFHKVKSGSLINNDASEAIGKAVYPYSGVPVTVLEKGTVGIDVELNINIYKNSDNTIATGKPYYIVISNEPFGNVTTDSIISAGENTHIKIYRDTAGTVNKKISIDESTIAGWNNGDIIYMRVKVDDTNYHARVTCSNVIVTTE